MSGLGWVGLRRAFVRCITACISAYSDDILGKGRLSGNYFVVLETCSFDVLVV